MARPERNNVDYFPYICKEGKTMYFIEQKYGNDGFATWIKILRELAVTNYHFLDLSDKVQIMYLASKCKVDQEKLIQIIDDLCDLGEFHDQLWLENRIIFSQKFIINIRDAYKKRNNKCIDLQGLLEILNDLGIRKLYKPLREVPEKPHTIVEYTKVENTIIDGEALKKCFEDLENSEVLITIAGNNHISVEKIKTLIPEFRKKAELSYDSRKLFIKHFKNSVPILLKGEQITAAQSVGPPKNQLAGKK